MDNDIPIYILIEKSVYSYFETYLHNKLNTNIVYAHVDSVNIFSLIEDILSKPKNNPVNYFDKYTDIETWLRDQWAGLFRELLNKVSSQQQLSSLTTQVGELREVNKTLKTYLEKVVTKIVPNDSASIISSESYRLDKALMSLVIKRNSLVTYISRFNFPVDRIVTAATKSKTIVEFVNALRKDGLNEFVCRGLLAMDGDVVERDYNLLKAQIANPEAAIAEEVFDRMSLKKGASGGKFSKPILDENAWANFEKSPREIDKTIRVEKKDQAKP